MIRKTALHSGLVLIPVCGALFAGGCASAPEPGVKKAREQLAAAPSTQSLPACFTKHVDKASRFSDLDYLRWLAGEGLHTAPARAIFERMKASADRGENYKALYFARLLTEVSPDLSGAWSNRAQLAGALGLNREKQDSEANSSNPGAVKHAAREFLPGMVFRNRPTTLPDWAAALNLMSDDVAQREGANAVVAVKDDVSGITQLVHSFDGERKPYASPRPIALDDLLPNTFVLINAHPMEEHNTNGGMLALGIFASALSGMNASHGNAAGAQQASAAAGGAMAEAFSVASHYKNGSYTARTYAAGIARDQVQKPRAAGEREAVETPLPITWASGGSSSPVSVMRLAQSNGKPAKIFAARYTADHAQKREEVRIPDVSYPRLASLCLTREASVEGQTVWRSEACTVGLSALELMLRHDDLASLIPDEAVRGRVLRASFDMSDWDQRYIRAGSEISVQTGNRSNNASFLGFDGSEVCYEVFSRPDRWFTSVSGNGSPAPRAAAR